MNRPKRVISKLHRYQTTSSDEASARQKKTTSAPCDQDIAELRRLLNTDNMDKNYNYSSLTPLPFSHSYVSTINNVLPRINVPLYTNTETVTANTGQHTNIDPHTTMIRTHPSTSQYNLIQSAQFSTQNDIYTNINETFYPDNISHDFQGESRPAQEYRRSDLLQNPPSRNIHELQTSNRDNR